MSTATVRRGEWTESDPQKRHVSNFKSVAEAMRMLTGKPAVDAEFTVEHWAAGTGVDAASDSNGTVSSGSDANEPPG